MSNSRFKFRVWDKEKGMIYPECCEMHEDSVITLGGQLCYVNCELYEKEGEIMQFTGLYDCEGREIWEEDIVKYQTSLDEGIALITWNSNLACYRLSVNKGGGLCHEINYPQPDWRYKVIGNRFENSELLEGKDV